MYLHTTESFTTVLYILSKVYLNRKINIFLSLPMSQLQHQPYKTVSLDVSKTQYHNVINFHIKKNYKFVQYYKIILRFCSDFSISIGIRI